MLSVRFVKTLFRLGLKEIFKNQCKKKRCVLQGLDFNNAKSVRALKVTGQL